jgi:precorrin-2 dehydrogenase/sirohydrochlorin ferrochelatase
MAEPTAKHERTYPIGLRVAGRRCVVVGGGPVAERKVRGLLACGAEVHAVAPAFTDALGAAAITRHRQEYEPAVLDGAVLVIAATDEPAVNTRVAADARAREIWVNVVDAPGECDFYCPAVVRRGPLAVAVHTGGAAPALAATLRRRLDAQFGPQWAELLEALGRLRRELLAEGLDAPTRRRRLRRLGDPAVFEIFAAEGIEGLRRHVWESPDGCDAF